MLELDFEIGVDELDVHIEVEVAPHEREEVVLLRRL